MPVNWLTWFKKQPGLFFSSRCCHWLQMMAWCSQMPNLQGNSSYWLIPLNASIIISNIQSDQHCRYLWIHMKYQTYSVI